MVLDMLYRLSHCVFRLQAVFETFCFILACPSSVIKLGESFTEFVRNHVIPESAVAKLKNGHMVSKVVVACEWI